MHRIQQPKEDSWELDWMCGIDKTMQRSPKCSRVHCWKRSSKWWPRTRRQHSSSIECVRPSLSCQYPWIGWIESIAKLPWLQHLHASEQSCAWAQTWRFYSQKLWAKCWAKCQQQMESHTTTSQVGGCANRALGIETITIQILPMKAILTEWHDRDDQGNAIEQGRRFGWNVARKILQQQLFFTG